MTESQERPSIDKTGGADGDTIARLLRLAGPRPGVPEAVEQRVKERTRSAWRRQTTTRRRRRYLWGGTALAAAAGLTLAILTLPELMPVAAPETSIRVATLTAATGVVSQIDADAAVRPRRRGEALFSGTAVETGPESRAALKMAGGSTLRLDRETLVALLGERSVRLERGAIYFDSAGDDLESGALEVQTPFGMVRDIGTQFEVRRADGLQIRVREGMVRLEREEDVHQAEAGVELRMSADGRLSRSTTPIFGPSWDWILDVSPTFTLEGHTLEAFLAWVSRETGREIEFADARTAAAASSVVLHGSIEGLRPDRALEAVLPTCGLERRIEGGILLIEAETR